MGNRLKTTTHMINKLHHKKICCFFHVHCHHGNISVQKLPLICTLYVVKMGEIWGWNQIDKKGHFSFFLHKIIRCSCVLDPKHMIKWRPGGNLGKKQHYYDLVFYENFMSTEAFT